MICKKYIGDKFHLIFLLLYCSMLRNILRNTSVQTTTKISGRGRGEWVEKILYPQSICHACKQTGHLFSLKLF